MTVRQMGFLVFVTMAALGAAGCGGKDMKVALKPSEEERNGTSASLARRVEVSYRDPQGHEQVRESVPVLSLSQPMSMREDLLKGVKVEKDGVFEARAYSGDGLLLLNGQASVDPDEADGVEIELGRRSGRPSDLASTMLRRVRLVGARNQEDISRDASELRKGMDEQRCVSLPPLVLDPSSGNHPRIILEGAVKAPRFSIEVGLGLGREALKFLSSRIQAVINPAGDAEIELGQKLLEGVLMRSPARLIFKIHSDHYEGCLELQTHPKVEPVTARFQLTDAVGTDLGVGTTVKAVGGLHVRNPNEAAVFVRIEGVAVSSESGHKLQPCFASSFGPVSRGQITCSDTMAVSQTLSPGGELAVGVFEGIAAGGVQTRRAMKTFWHVRTSLSADDPGIPTEVSDGMIP